MSNIAQEFEKNLDNAKYDLLEACRHAVNCANNYTWHYGKNQRIFLELARRAVAKVENLTGKQ